MVLGALGEKKRAAGKGKEIPPSAMHYTYTYSRSTPELSLSLSFALTRSFEYGFYEQAGSGRLQGWVDTSALGTEVVNDLAVPRARGYLFSRKALGAPLEDLHPSASLARCLASRERPRLLLTHNWA